MERAWEAEAVAPRHLLQPGAVSLGAEALELWDGLAHQLGVAVVVEPEVLCPLVLRDLLHLRATARRNSTGVVSSSAVGAGGSESADSPRGIAHAMARVRACSISSARTVLPRMQCTGRSRK